MEITERIQFYALAAVNHPESGSIDNVRNFLTDLIADSHGTQSVSVICDTMYDHETGMHKGTGRGCFWTY